MPEPFHLPGEPRKPLSDKKIDITKRYDVYCSDRAGLPGVVYRNVLFRGMKELFSGRQFGDLYRQFVELEQEGGRTFYVNSYAITSFCEHGTKLNVEKL